MRIGATLVAAFLAMPAVAGEAPPGAPGDIPPGEWAEFAHGKTLTYTIGGLPWAYEQYHPDPASRLVWIELIDGTCMSGQWAYEAGNFCFYWEQEGGPACFRHVRQGGQIMVIPQANGRDSGDVQVMTEVTERPLSCSFGLSS